MKQKTPPPKRILGKSRRFFFSFCVGAFFILGALGVILALTADISPALDEALFEKTGKDQTTRLYYYDADTDAFIEWREERVEAGGYFIPAVMDTIPKSVCDAFVAMEDHRFYRHAGVDILRTAKAVVNRLLGERERFGGSTITQQLIKNIGGERDRTVKRKIREMTRAQMLETRHTKDEILEAYLNIVPMAEGCVGIGAAAENYFGKRVSELSLAEAASLAAMTPAPARLNPRANAEKHLARRNLVLDRMAELGYITEEECLSAQGEALTLADEGDAKDAPRSWYAERVLFEVKENFLDKGYTESAANALIYGGGLRIYTALDKMAQRAAEKALSREKGEGFHAAVTVFSPETGKLVALVGDLGEKRGNRLFSYATDMRRAPGSVLKPPALYAPAIDEGRITEATVFDDVPSRFEGARAWPKNTPDVYDGLILAKDALVHSKNTVAVSLFHLLGAEHIYATLKNSFGISGLVRRSVSEEGEVRTDLAEAPLALGELTEGVSLFEMTRAYLPFSNGGKMQAGDTLIRVENAGGEVLLSGREQENAVISQETALVMTHMLKGVAEEGSAKTLKLPTLVDTAGKTGSSGGNRDRWFIGYTPYYLCGVWCGYETGKTPVTGTPHLSLFDDVMMPLHQELPDDGVRSFQVGHGLRYATVCKDSGKMQTILCKEDARGDRSTTVLLPKAAHLGSCTTHRSVFYDEENGGVAYPPEKGREGSLKRVSLIAVGDRAFPFEVTVKDAEYVYRDPAGTEPPDGDVPFFAATVPKGVYIGKSHDGRPYNAAAHTTSPPFSSESEEGAQKPPTVGRLPRAPQRKKLPRFRFWLW